MSEQPRALRLADGLEDAYPNVYTGLAQSSAAELRRLHALCEEMGEALKGVVRVADRATDEFDAARAALAKWKESK